MSDENTEPVRPDRTPVARPGGLRASDADRASVAQRLEEAVGEGRLGLDEFADRTAAAYAAVTTDQLAVLTEDLPTAAPVGERVDRVTAILGDSTRSGTWRTSGSIRVATVLGDATLDLRGVHVDGDEIVVHGFTVMGDVRVIVPEGSEVTVRGTVVLGDRRMLTTPSAPVAGLPRVRIEVVTIMGDIEVRNEPRSRRFLDGVRRAFGVEGVDPSGPTLRSEHGDGPEGIGPAR